MLAASLVVIYFLPENLVLSGGPALGSGQARFPYQPSSSMKSSPTLTSPVFSGRSVP